MSQPWQIGAALLKCKVTSSVGLDVIAVIMFWFMAFTIHCVVSEFGRNIGCRVGLRIRATWRLLAEGGCGTSSTPTSPRREPRHGTPRPAAKVSAEEAMVGLRPFVHGPENV